jgi:hypothetical protein
LAWKKLRASTLGGAVGQPRTEEQQDDGIGEGPRERATMDRGARATGKDEREKEERMTSGLYLSLSIRIDLRAQIWLRGLE